jgi:serine/threonine-protein kinase RsbW
MEIEFVLCLPRDEVSVPMVRRLCGASMRKLGVSDSCAQDIELAVTEAASNVLRHAAGSDREYEVRVHVREDQCEIKVVDPGSARFDHKELPSEPPLPTAESGRGIYVMKALVDDLSLVSEEGGTVVTLRKRLEFSEDSILRRGVDSHDVGTAPPGGA